MSQYGNYQKVLSTEQQIEQAKERNEKRVESLGFDLLLYTAYCQSPIPDKEYVKFLWKRIKETNEQIIANY